MNEAEVVEQGHIHGEEVRKRTGIPDGGRWKKI